MNCYDCATQDRLTRPAVGICHDCGAGVCVDHSHRDVRWLTRTALINRVETIDPPERIIRCGICAAAHEAAAHPADHRVGTHR